MTEYGLLHSSNMSLNGLCDEGSQNGSSHAAIAFSPAAGAGAGNGVASDGDSSKSDNAQVIDACLAFLRVSSFTVRMPHKHIHSQRHLDVSMGQTLNHLAFCCTRRCGRARWIGCPAAPWAWRALLDA